MLRCNSLPNKTCPISMKLGRNHKDQKPKKIRYQTNKQIRQFSKLIFFWFSYWVKSTILSLRNRPSLPLSLNMHRVNQNAFIVSFPKQKYDKLELPCLVEEWHDKDFTLYTATKIQKLDHGLKSMKHISEQTSVHNQEYIYIERIKWY